MTKQLLLAVIILLALVAVVEATTCTRGVDCYCDRVRTNASVNGLPNIFDSSLLMCEDFEAPTLYQNTGFGQGAPNFGPWWDATGGCCINDRGHNSYWQNTYGAGTQGAIWAQGEPTSPTLGAPCNVPGFQGCTGLKVWHPQNLWNANNLVPSIGILRNGDFQGEVNVTNPTGAAGGGSGVFDGSQVLFQRVPKGTNQMPNGGTGAITGFKGFGGARRTFGATMAMAFPSNLQASNITGLDAAGNGQNWKFNEWHPVLAGSGGDGLLAFGYANKALGAADFPFYGFVFAATNEAAWQADGGITFRNNCNAALAAATKSVGTFACDTVSMTWFATANTLYNQAVDWPLGTWGCIKGTYVNMGAANASIKLTFTPTTGPRAGQEITVIDISNLNMGFGPARLQSQPGGYDGFVFDDFYNGNDQQNNPNNNVGTLQVTGRYEDNIHIRLGSPVSCAQIGFGTVAPPTTFQLNVSKAGTGTGTVTSSPAGINCGATCSATFNSGSLVTLTAVAGGGSTFTGWSGGGCSGTGTCTVPMSSDQFVTATFGPPSVTLTVTKTGSGTGTVTSNVGGINCGGSCSASVTAGTTIILTATPTAGSTFGGWSGGGCSGFGTCTVTVNSNTTVNAIFTFTSSAILDSPSCQLSDVQDTFNRVTAITTQVNIPARPPGQECHWTGQAVLVLPPGMNHDFAIIGAGSQTTDGGSNATVIVDDNTVNNELISIDASALAYPRVFRISGLFIYRSLGVAKGQGFIKYIGANQVRVDHNTFYGFGGMYNMVLYCATGVIDRNIADFGFQAPVGAGGKGNCDQWGDFSWSQPTNFGTDGFLFLENNIFQPNDPNNPIGGNHGDCRGGGRIVVRYNNMRGVISHGDDGDLGRQRGCRALEVYGNTFTDASGGVSFDTVAIVTGTALVWGNNITTPGSYSVFTSLHMGRASTTEGPRQGWPNDWGFCGIVATSGGVQGGGPSLIDQNTDSTGWRCLDMVGTGQGDLLVNDFPNVTNQTLGCGPSVNCVWPRNAREPVYEWLTTGFSGPGSQRVHPFETHVIIENRDYYIYQGLAVAEGGPFNGTVGTGSGTLSHRPATCTPGAGNTPGVGYWATDVQTFYVCTSSNVWTQYYKPFTYPHPLTGAAPQQQPPSAPSGFHFN